MTLIVRPRCNDHSPQVEYVFDLGVITVFPRSNDCKEIGLRSITSKTYPKNWVTPFYRPGVTGIQLEN